MELALESHSSNNRAKSKKESPHPVQDVWSVACGPDFAHGVISATASPTSSPHMALSHSSSPRPPILIWVPPPPPPTHVHDRQLTMAGSAASNLYKCPMSGCDDCCQWLHKTCLNIPVPTTNNWFYPGWHSHLSQSIVTTRFSPQLSALIILISNTHSPRPPLSYMQICPFSTQLRSTDLHNPTVREGLARARAKTRTGVSPLDPKHPTHQ